MGPAPAIRDSLVHEPKPLLGEMKGQPPRGLKRQKNGEPRLLGPGAFAM